MVLRVGRSVTYMDSMAGWMPMAEAAGGPETCSYEAREDDPSNWHGDEWTLEEGSWSCPHEVLDHPELPDADLCVFHMDPENVPDDVDEAEEFLRVVNEESAEADGERARRLKEFVGAEFGELEMEGIVLDARDGYPIVCANAVFTGNVVLRSSTIEQAFLAPQTRFESSVSFNNADFAGEEGLGAGVSFRGATFRGEGGVGFRDVIFGNAGHVWFRGTVFRNEGFVSFADAEFRNEGDAVFGRAEFRNTGDVRFEDSEFRNEGKIGDIDAGFQQGNDVWDVACF